MQPKGHSFAQSSTLKTLFRIESKTNRMHEVEGPLINGSQCYRMSLDAFIRPQAKPTYFVIYLCRVVFKYASYI